MLKLEPTQLEALAGARGRLTESAPEPGPTPAPRAPRSLAIRPEQLVELQQSARTRFVGRVLEGLAQCFPAEVLALPRERARARVRAGIDQAAAHGFITESEVFRFIALCFVFGDRFTGEAWAAPILADETLTRPSERMAGLYEAARARSTGTPP